jgi:hypothetical protein
MPPPPNPPHTALRLPRPTARRSPKPPPINPPGTALSHRRHLLTSLRAMPAGLRTNAAMLHPSGRMHPTLLCTSTAHLRTQLTHLLHKFPVQVHHTDRRLANKSTLQIQPDTRPQRMHIILFQTGIRTLMTHRRTIRTCIDTILIFCVRHNK